MMDDSTKFGQGSHPAGLCGTCQHARRITNDRGSVFIFCELSKIDGRFAKYPRLPVQQCAGYQPAVTDRY